MLLFQAWLVMRSLESSVKINSFYNHVMVCEGEFLIPKSARFLLQGSNIFVLLWISDHFHSQPNLLSVPSLVSHAPFGSICYSDLVLPYSALSFPLLVFLLLNHPSFWPVYAVETRRVCGWKRVLFLSRSCKLACSISSGPLWLSQGMFAAFCVCELLKTC